MTHIGDCDHCPSTNVRIVYGWNRLIPNNHCIPCNEKRLRDAAKAKGKSGFMKAPETDQHKEDRATKALMKAHLIDQNGHICEECGATKNPLDLSHLISVGARKDLELELENVVLHCSGLDKCHAKWENGSREWKLASATFRKHGAYILKHSIKFH